MQFQLRQSLLLKLGFIPFQNSRYTSSLLVIRLCESLFVEYVCIFNEISLIVKLIIFRGPSIILISRFNVDQLDEKWKPWYRRVLITLNLRCSEHVFFTGQTITCVRSFNVGTAVWTPFLCFQSLYPKKPISFPSDDCVRRSKLNTSGVWFFSNVLHSDWA